MHINNILLRRGKWLCWLLAPLLLFIPFPFFPPAMLWGNTDALFYTNVLAMMSESVRAGEFFPRWLASANAGFGSPVMMFYAPLAYIMTALINWPFAALHLDVGIQLMAGIYVAQVLSGVTAYLWLKRSFSERTALIGSLLFVLLPYKFIYIYLHINLAQLWALALLPLWMLAAEKLLADGMRAIGLYAFVFSGVYYCHPVTVLAFGGVPALYVLWYGRGQGFFKRYGKLALANLLGIGICLMQALPQSHFLPMIHEEGFLQGKLDWHENLYHIDLFLCAYYGFIAAIVVYGAAQCRLKTKSPFWAVIIAVIAFMNLPVSAFLWEYVPLLKYLQFPAARLHAAALVGTIYLICVWLDNYKELRPLSQIAFRKAVLAAFIGVFGFMTGLHIYNEYTAPNNLTQDYVADARGALLIIPPEYKTQWGCIAPEKALEFYANHTLPDPITVAQGKADISDIVWQSGKIIFNADVQSRDALINVRQCYFPLWNADDKAMPWLSIFPNPDNATGVMQLPLPKGKHTIALSFNFSSQQWIGFSIALFSLLLSVMLCLCGRRQ